MRIGAYEVLGELGRGGMGAVYRVRGPDGREAALKLLRSVDGAAFARFERERRLLASLGEEDGFVGLLDAGTASEGPWLLMPLVAGGTLRDRLGRGPLGLEATVALGAQLAGALGAAHERGIVHRDVKPENVLFTREGKPLLADLGLAKHFDRLAGGASQSISLTRDGSFKGTAGYSAPEQLADASRAGPPADVFALGAVLHECLSGSPAFPGATVLEMMARVSAGTPEPVGKDVPAWLRSVLRKALESDPRARFASGDALARALSERGTTKSKGRWIPALVAAIVALVLVVAAAVLRGGSGRSRALVAEGEELDRRRELDAALAAFTRAIELDPRLAVAWMGRGRVRAEKYAADAAIADETKAIELDPSLAKAWSVRGSARLQRGDVEAAIADETRAVELDPAFASAWRLRALARTKKNDRDGALADANRAVALEPGNPMMWAVRASVRSDRHELDEAIADDTRAIELDPRYVDAWLDRGVTRGNKGDLEGQIADMTKALALKPNDAGAWQGRGWARLVKGDFDEAIADATRSLELDPRVALVWSNRGHARYGKGDRQGAFADATRAIELDPKLASAWKLRGEVRGQDGDSAGAIADLSTALELDPQNASTWLNRGVARAQLRDFDEAIVDLSRAIELDPGDANGWANRGHARLDKGALPDAIADLERALELQPTGPGAELVRTALERAKERVRR
jgi:tetratricopeptide (TPR) repeat protein